MLPNNARIAALEDDPSKHPRPNMLYILTCPPTDDGSAQITFQPVTAEMAKKEPGPRLHAAVSPVKDTPVTELPDDFAEDSVSELTIQGLDVNHVPPGV